MSLSRTPVMPLGLLWQLSPGNDCIQTRYESIGAEPGIGKQWHTSARTALVAVRLPSCLQVLRAGLELQQYQRGITPYDVSCLVL